MISKYDHTKSLIKGLEDIKRSLTAGHTQDWAHTLRTQGLSRFLETGIPTVKDEEWKYTNLSPLTGFSFARAQDNTLVETEALSQYADDSELKIVFVNGLYSEKLSSLADLPKGITVSTLQEAQTKFAELVERMRTRYDVNKAGAFVALNEAIAQDGVFIHAAAHTVHPDLIHIIHVTSSNHAETVSLPRALIYVEKSCELTVLESHVAFKDDLTYFANALTDIILEENATLHYCKAQKESLNAFHIGHTRVWQERHSNFDGFTFTAGGKITRNDLDIILNGEGADAVLNALYSAYQDQHIDNHTSVDHRVPNCTSNQLYKGILNHSARAVFNGKVFVRPIAQQTNSYQLNKNLLLGTDCRVDTKPQLEIFADDVKCTHGATIGQLDEDEMFYLQTRCIPRNMATRMLVHGFVDDLFNKIKNDAIHRKVDYLMQPSFEVFE